MGRLLLRLVVGLLKLLLQIALLLLTGKWLNLTPREKRAEHARPPKRTEHARPPKRAERARPLTPARPGGERAPLFTAGDPVLEGGRERKPRKQQKQRTRAQSTASPRLPSPRSAEEARSLKSALRDRRVLRDALVLGAALGPRKGRD